MYLLFWMGFIVLIKIFQGVIMRIGKHEVPYPLIQGGMAVRVSGYRLAGNVARCGGIGLVATAGMAMSNQTRRGKP